MTKTRFFLPILAAVAATAALAPAASADPVTGGTAAVIDCAARVDYNAYVSSARGMSCRAAAKDLRRYRGVLRQRFSTPGGFSCYQVSGIDIAGQWRCVKGSRAYRFEFQD
jgi:hypothetical protein